MVYVLVLLQISDCACQNFREIHTRRCLLPWSRTISFWTSSTLWRPVLKSSLWRRSSLIIIISRTILRWSLRPWWSSRSTSSIIPVHWWSLFRRWHSLLLLRRRRRSSLIEIIPPHIIHWHWRTSLLWWRTARLRRSYTTSVIAVEFLRWKIILSLLLRMTISTSTIVHVSIPIIVVLCISIIIIVIAVIVLRVLVELLRRILLSLWRRSLVVRLWRTWPLSCSSIVWSLILLVISLVVCHYAGL